MFYNMTCSFAKVVIIFNTRIIFPHFFVHYFEFIQIALRGCVGQPYKAMGIGECAWLHIVVV